MKIAVSNGKDLTTIIGIFAGLCFVGYGMVLGGNPSGFLNMPSVFIVVLGTIAVTSACFAWEDMVSLFKSLNSIVFLRLNDKKALATAVIGIAEHSKKKGILGLQEKEDDIDKSTLLFRGVRMLVDGNKIEEIEPIMYQFIQNTIDRNQKAAAVLRKGAEIAPAMGLIGTLIGLVQMLGQLEDPSGIGKPMAVAMLTTLYGALIAYMFLTPLASKIDRNSDEELIINKIFLTAVVSIGKMEHPRTLQNHLNVILPPNQRVDIYK